MKKYLLGIFAVIVAVAGVAYTNAPAKKSSPYACTWYYYTGAASGNTAPINLTQSRNQGNYVVATAAQLNECTSTAKLCAICANPDTRPGHSGQPYIETTEEIDSKLVHYWGAGGQQVIPNFIVEKP